MANWWEQSEEKKKLEQKAQPAQPFRAPQQLVQNVLDTVQSAAQKVQKKAAEHAKQEAALPNWWKNSQERQGLQAKVSESRQYQSYLEKLKAAAPAQYAAETMGPAKLQRELGRSQEALRQAQEARSAARQQNQDWRPSYMTNIQPAQKDAYDLEYDRAYRDSAVMEQAQRIQNADRRENMYQSIRDRMEALKTGSPADYDAKVKAGREAFEAKQNSAREAEIWQAINEDRAWNPQLRDAGGSNYDKRIDSSLLSNQQKNHFYALYAEDPEQAEEWLGTAYERQQNKMLDTVSTLAGYNAGTRAVAAVGSAAMGLASGLDPYNDFGQGASKIANALASGGAKGLQEKGLFNTGILAGTIDEDVPIIGGKGLGDLYQLSVSMLQSGALVLAAGASGGAAPVVELLGTTLMGSSAAASDYTDCIENRGMSRDQAMLHATAAGIAEAAFEYVSLDKLVNQDITRGFIKNFFMQGGIEASEELCTTVANRITDAALARAGGYDNQIEQRMKELIALGLDTREAKAKAEREWVTELISDGLGGFLSGGAMTGINTGLHAGDYNWMNRYLEQTGRDSMRSGEAAVLRQYAEDNGLGWYGETEAPAQTNDNGGQIARATENGETDSSAPAEASAQNDGETAQASDATSSASQSEAPSPQGEGTEKKSRKESRQERMGQRQTGSDVERIQKHMNQQMEGKSIQEQQALRDQLQERYGEGILPAAYAAIQEDIRNVTQDMSPDQIQRAMTEALKQTNDREMRGAIAQAYSQAGAEAANKKGGSSEVAKFYQQMRNTGRGGMTMQATVTAQDGTRQQMEIQNFTEDGKGIRLSNGQTVAINKDLNKNLEADADTVDAIQRLAEFGLGKDTDAVFQLYKATSPQTKTDGYRWIMDAAMAYDQGRVGRISMLEAMRRSSLDRQTVAQLYKMGQRSDTADTQARQARIDQARQEAGQESQAKVDAKAIKGIELTETEKEQFEMANDIFRAIGVDLVWFASDADGDGTFRGKNGAYLNGKVYLDIHAGRNFASDLRSGILATAGHELTHFLQDYAPKAYKSLRRFLLDQIAGNAANGELTLERLIDDKMRRSSEGITREEALDEVVADACQRMLLDSKALHDYAEQAPGHMKRLRGWVKDWYERIKAAFGKSTELSYEARLMNSLAEDVREAFGDLWDAALREAVETHREVGNLKGEKNTAQEGGVKYSERDTQEILHLKEQIRQAQNTLNRMPIVGTATSEIVFDENNVSAAVDWACSRIGVPKAVHREGFGDVLFDRKRVNKGFNYLPGRKGSAGRNLLGQAYTVAVTLAPQVVQSGIEINHHINHKNYGHDTWTFAAPVQIDGERGNLAVVVKKTSNNYYDVHSILTPDGGLMVLDATKKAEASDGGVFLPEAVTPSKLSADFSILDSSEKSNPSMEKYSERDYSYDFSDTDLILDAADLAADPETAESYWKELLDVMDRKDAVDARAQLKGIREQGKKIQELEAKLENAMHQMEQTDRKLRTQGIGKVTQAVMEEFEVSDAKKRGVAKKATAAITQAYQKALDAMDNGAEAAAATDILYEGAVKAANILLDEGTHTERHFGKWAVGSYSSYIKEDRQLLIDTMVSKVYEDFAVNRYRDPVQATAADRLVERTERRMQKKVDEARDRARTVQEANDRLQREIDYAQNEADASKQQVGELAQQLRDLRDQVKEDKQLTGQERSKAQRRIKTLENALKAKRSESQAWKQLADKQARQLEKDAHAQTIQGINSRVDLFRERLARTNEELRANKAERALNDTTRKLNETARKLSSTANQLQKQLEREQRILNGMLKPPAIQKLLKAEREKAVAKAEEHKDEVFRNYKERKSATELRRRIGNLKEELQRRLSNPTDRSYVPAGLATAMVDMLDAIDNSPRAGTQAAAKYQSASEALRALAQAYDEISSSEDVGYEYKSEYDEELRDQLRSLAKELQGKKLRDMSLEELQSVYDFVKAIRDGMRQATKMLNSSQWNDVYDAIRSVVDQQQSMTSFADAKKREQNKRLRMLDNMSVMRAVEMMSGWDRNAALYQLMHGVENGARDAMGWVMNYNKSLLDLKTGKNERAYRRALSKTEDFGAVDKTSGTAVKMTKLQAIQLYMTWQREAHNDKLLHLQRGGATIRDAIAIQDGKGSRAASHTIRVTPELIARIEGSFTDWDRAYMKAVRDYLTREAKATNQVLYKLKHRVLTTEDYYVPYIVDKGYLETKLEGSDVFNLFVKTPGSTQALQKKAPQPVIIDGMDTMLAKHVQDTANYVGLALPIRDFAKVYNGRLAAEEDGEVYTSLKKTIQDNFQDKGLNLIVQALLDVQGGSKGNSWSTHIAENLNKLQGAFVRSALLINPSVTIKQAASYIAGESILSHRALTAGNRPIFTGQDASHSPSLIAQLFAAPEGRTAQRLYDEIDQHTSLHYERRLGMSQVELANEAQRSGKLRRWMNGIGAGMEQSSLGHGVRKAGEMLNPVTWIQRMDVATTAALWVAAKEQARMDLGITDSSPAAQNDAFWQRTTELYERVIRETQPMYDGLHRTANQKQHGGIMTYLFPFRTVPIQNHGQVASSYEALLATKGKSKAEQAAARKFFAKTVWANTESAFIFSLMTFLAAALKRKTKKYRNEDEELTPWSLGEGIGKDMLSTWFSVLYPVFGSELWNVGSRIADKIEGSSGYTYDAFSVGVVDMLNDLSSAGDKLWTDAGKLMRGEDVSLEDLGSHGLALLTKAGKLAGIPADTIKTYVEGTLGNVEDLRNGRIPALNDESWERSAGVNAERYLKAWLAGDLDKVDAVEAEMLRTYQDNGKTEEKAQEALKSKLTSTAKAALAEGRMDSQDAMDFLEETGFYDGDQAWKKVREWSETAEHAEDEDYSYSTYKPLYEAIDANHEIADMVAEMTAHGIQESNIKSQVKSYLVEQYVAGKVSKDKLKNQLSRYCKIVATDDVSKILNDADCKKACGYGTGELNEAYRAGNLDSSTVSSMLQRYGGMSAEDAKKRVRWLDLQKANPSLEVSESNCNNWYDGSAKSRENGHESAKAAGMSIEQYLQAKAVLDKAKDANGNGTGEDEVIAALSQMNLTAKQKDALYYERYKGTTKYAKKTW